MSTQGAWLGLGSLLNVHSRLIAESTGGGSHVEGVRLAERRALALLEKRAGCNIIPRLIWGRPRC
jgi:hypothetical protein